MLGSCGAASVRTQHFAYAVCNNQERSMFKKVSFNMSLTDVLHLPLAAKILVAVLLWPAIWAGALMIVALRGDLIRGIKKQDMFGVAGGALNRR
jgi:hypothetical protein